jgi:hypothetical protein
MCQEVKVEVVVKADTAAGTLVNVTTWKVSNFVDREDLNVSDWHQYSQYFIAGFSFGKIPLT